MSKIERTELSKQQVKFFENIGSNIGLLFQGFSIWE